MGLASEPGAPGRARSTASRRRVRERLSSLTAPLSLDLFLTSHWGEQPLLCRGPADRFADLLSWPTLNRILEHHWRETFRFRLARRGRDLDPASYVDRSGVTPRVRSAEVTAQLRRGATLSFDAIDELHEPLTDLAASCEAFFGGGTKINVYAGWGAVHGLDLHRDDQEIFILHLDGRKRWFLYGPSIDHLDRGGLERESHPPDGAVLDEVLDPGAVLYIPRGCYHVAVPVSDHALHLTLSVKNPRRRDLLQWLAARIEGEGAAAADLPWRSGEEARVAYSDAVRAAVSANLERDLVAQYYAEGSNVKDRPSFSLPWSATPALLPPGDDFFVKLAPCRSVVVHDGAVDLVEVHARGQAYRFPSAMQSVIEALDGAPGRIGQIVETFAGTIDEPALRMLLGMLVKHGLASVDP